MRLAPEHIAGDARTRRVTSLRYYWSCMSSIIRIPLLCPHYVSARRSLLIAAAIQPDSLDIVLTRLLVSMQMLRLSAPMMNQCRALGF